jgi:hypothetical protein
VGKERKGLRGRRGMEGLCAYFGVSWKGSIIYYLIQKLSIEHRQIHGVGKQHINYSSSNDNDIYLLLLLPVLYNTTVQFQGPRPSCSLHARCKLITRRVLQLLQLRFRRPLSARRPRKAVLTFGKLLNFVSHEVELSFLPYCLFV